MKIANTATYFMLFAAVALTASCENGKRGSDNKDEKEAAKEMNDEKFETRDSEKRADFLVGAVSANIAEIAMVNLAMEKSKNADVLALARQLEKDHTLILSELRSFSEKRGVTVPSEMSSADSTKLTRLAEEKPEDFDKAWLKDMEDRHQMSMDKYRKCAEKNDDVELQTLANRHLVMIESHHHQIEKLLDK